MPELAPPPLGSLVRALLADRPDLPNHELLARVREHGADEPPSVVLEAARDARGLGSASVTTARTTAPIGASDRERDLFTSEAKARSREGNLLAVLQQAPELWDDEARTQLRCAWCELMGESGDLTLAMLERAAVLAPGAFVGVDHDTGRIANLRAARPDLRWVDGDLFDAASMPVLEDVGVLNYDAYDTVGGPRTRAAVRQLGTIVRSGLDRFGAFALFWNADLDAVARRGRAPASELRRHADELAGLLAELVGHRRVITGDMLLPPGAELNLVDGTTGQVGAFQVYRGRPGGHRMANLRLILR